MVGPTHESPTSDSTRLPNRSGSTGDDEPSLGSSCKTDLILGNRMGWAFETDRCYLGGFAIRISPRRSFWPGLTVNSLRISGPVWPQRMNIQFEEIIGTSASADNPVDQRGRVKSKPLNRLTIQSDHLASTVARSKGTVFFLAGHARFQIEHSMGMPVHSCCRLAGLANDPESMA